MDGKASYGQWGIKAVHGFSIEEASPLPAGTISYLHLEFTHFVDNSSLNANQIFKHRT